MDDSSSEGRSGARRFSVRAVLSFVVLVVLLPLVLFLAAVVAKTALEGRLLQSQLSGHVEYSRRTRYRPVPGIW